MSSVALTSSGGAVTACRFDRMDGPSASDLTGSPRFSLSPTQRRITAEGSGSKILVTASVLDYVKDKPDPKQLDEAALPKWINERTDKLRVLIHKRVQAMLSSRAKQ